MLRLFVLLTVVVYCNSCSLDVPNDGTTNGPDCHDKEGNSHMIYSEWSTDSERCVCSTYGTICCPRDWGKWIAEHSGQQENGVDWEKGPSEHSGEQENGGEWEKWNAEHSGEQENGAEWEKWHAEHSGDQDNGVYDHGSNVGVTDFIADDFAAFT